MDLVELIKLSLRRWYVVLPIVGASLVIAYFVQQRAPEEYAASGVVMLASPELDPSGLPRAIIDIDTALVEVESDEGRAELAAAGATAEFMLRRIDANLVEVYVSSESLPTALDTATAVVERLADHVFSTQEEAGVPSAEQIRPRTMVQDSTAASEEGGSFAVVGSLYLDDPVANSLNPYGADGSTSRLLEAAVESDAGRMRFYELAGPVTFDVGLPSRDSGGIMNITTTGTDPELVLNGFEHAKTILAEELDRRQARADVPSTQRIVIDTLAEPQVVTAMASSLDRAAFAVLGLGGLLAIALVLLVESLSARRRPKGPGGRNRALAHADDEDAWLATQFDELPAADELAPSGGRSHPADGARDRTSPSG